MGVDQEYMQMVLQLAAGVPAVDVPVAAIVVRDAAVLAEGINTREASGLISGHAEINAIQAAAKQLGSWNLNGATLYVNLEPCPMCAGAILEANISRVVFGAYQGKSGALGSRYLVATPRLEVLGGVMELESQELLREFFRGLR